MANTEKFTSCRLIGNEISYIEKFWDGSFSDYVHNSIKRDIQELEKQKNKARSILFKEFSLYLVIFALGTIFFLFAGRSLSLIEMYTAFILGVFFTSFGIVGGVIVALQAKPRKK